MKARATAAAPTVRRALVRRVLRRLEKAYGSRPWRRHAPALDELIRTILSQNTNDRNSHRAFDLLRQRFPSWQEAAAAPRAQIAAAIRVAGLSRVKAGYIEEILRRVQQERGEYSLEFLRRLPLERAMEYLLHLPGVGMKTAACVLLFSFGMPAFPVDVHIWRVSRRLGLAPAAAGREEAQEFLQHVVPPEAVYPLHLLLIELGRKVCRARRPAHEGCPLRRHCPSAELPDELLPDRKAPRG